MIREFQEPKGLDRDATPLGAFLQEADHRANAERGSLLLMEAILRAKGHPIPARKPYKVRALKPVPVRHEPTCCDKCGSPLKPLPALVSHIQATVAAYYGLPTSSMTSARRGYDVAHPRQIAMFLASELTPKSLPDIGRRFGGRDHTTVIHAIKAVKGRIAADPEIAADVAALREKLSGHEPAIEAAA